MVGGDDSVVDGTACDPRADMKTTSQLGGRKAHTAKKRRVRYETSTRVRGVGVVVRIVRTLLHARERSTSGRPGPVGPTGSGPTGPRADHGRQVRTSCPPSTTLKKPTSVTSTANRWKSPSGRQPSAASRATPYRSLSSGSTTSRTRP